MKVGHCFTIEPMISEGTWRDEHWPGKERNKIKCRNEWWISKCSYRLHMSSMYDYLWWFDFITDEWTAVTGDGKLSAQFEETLLVTDTGVEILTRRQDQNGQPYFMDV